MLVVQDEDDRILPEGPIANRIHDLRDVILPALNVGGRVLVILKGVAFEAEIRIDK
jgi:hypothetical protein